MRTPSAYPILLSDEQLTKIGRFIVLWNQAEMLIHHTVQLLLRVEVTTSEVVMGTTSVDAKLSIYGSVCQEKLKGQDKILGCANAARSEICGLIRFRNDLAHARWGIAPDFSKGSRKLTPGAATVPVEEIDTKTDAISLVTNRLAFVLWEAWKITYPDLTLHGHEPWKDIALLGIDPLLPNRRKEQRRKSKHGLPSA